MIPKWRVFFLLNARGDNLIKQWLKEEKVPKEQVAVFQDKIDTLELSGPDLVPGFISETPVAPHIYKMKVKGSKGWKQLRPMCCKGPFAIGEYTVLVGAIERDNKLPKNAKRDAQRLREELILDPARRRRERLTG